MKQILTNDWNDYLAAEFSKDYYQKLRQFLIKEYHSRIIYPDMHDIFNALHYTSYADTKVVILGQDPYHGPKPSSRSQFFGTSRGSYSAVIIKYLQRTA